MVVVGINAFFENPAVVFLKGSEILFAIEEERLTGIKHGRRYSPFALYIPFRAIYAGLCHLDLHSDDIDVLAYSYSPRAHVAGILACLRGRKFTPVTDELSALVGLLNLRKALSRPYEILQHMSDRLTPAVFSRKRIVCFDHHLCHAASAFTCSGYEESLILVADGSGEHAATSLYLARDNRLRRLKSFDMPHSLGFLYSGITRYLGWDDFKDEGKVMALAAYGRPAYRSEFANIVQWDRRGNYRICRKAFLNLRDLLPPPPREKGEEVRRWRADVASTLQATLEEILMCLLRTYREQTGARKLCLAGGVALNCRANGKIADSGLFDEIFVQPAAHDAGTALGAAALASAGDDPSGCHVAFPTAYLGTEYSDQEILKTLEKARVPFEKVQPTRLARIVGRRLSQNQVGALFRGRMEFGPRALGNRSILASPMEDEMSRRVNRLKGREQFRPLAPVVKEEAFERFFVGEKNRFMTVACHVPLYARSVISAAVHIDGTARVQVVGREDNPFLYAVLEEFEKITGIPVLINTSFNALGRPIVESPVDAVACFYTTGLDFLVVGDFLLTRSAGPSGEQERSGFAPQGEGAGALHRPGKRSGPAQG